MLIFVQDQLLRNSFCLGNDEEKTSAEIPRIFYLDMNKYVSKYNDVSIPLNYIFHFDLSSHYPNVQYRLSPYQMDDIRQTREAMNECF